MKPDAATPTATPRPGLTPTPKAAPASASTHTQTRPTGVVRVTGVARVIRAIAEAAERWGDADFPPRVRTTRALIERTGYTAPVVDYALDALFRSLTAAALEDTIAGELGSLAALDGFVARPGRPDVRFAGVARTAIVSSDTTIGVAVPALAFALCAGSHVIVKDRSDRLITAFAATLAEELPELAQRIEASMWNGADEAASRAQLESADTVVAFGRGETLAAIRALLRPDARFVPFGHRTSVGYVARETLVSSADAGLRAGSSGRTGVAGRTIDERFPAARSAALGAARDALLFEGEGCLSLHVLFVERGAPLDPGAFARVFARALDEMATEFPAGYAEIDAASTAYRRAAIFRAAQKTDAAFGGGTPLGGSGTPLCDARATHHLTLDPPFADPPPFLRRTVALYGVSGPQEALAFLRRHALPLEAVAFGDAAPRADLVDFALAAGAARIAALGELQRPPLGGEHGGSGRILPFVRAIYRG